MGPISKLKKKLTSFGWKVHIQMDSILMGLASEPDLIENVLFWLDTNSLKNLRLVCKATRSWVDIPKYLQKIPVYIGDEERLQQVRKSKINWKNFKICLPIRDDLATTNMTKFLRRFKSSTTHLNVDLIIPIETSTGNTTGHGVYTLLNIFSNLPHRIQILTIRGTFCTEKHTSNSLEQMRQFRSLDGKLFAELTHVNLQFEVGDEFTMKFVANLFSKIIDSAPNLIHISIPVVFASRNWIYRGLEAIGCDPLLKFATNVSKMSKRPHNPSINFCSTEEYYLTRWYNEYEIEGEGRAVYPFDLEVSDLMELVKVFAPCNGKLFNVPSTAMPSKDECKELSVRDMEYLEDCIKTVLCTPNPGLHLQDMYIPQHCKTKIAYRLGRADPEEGDFDFPTEWNLSSIQLHPGAYRRRPDFIVNLLESNIFSTVRPSMEEFRIMSTHGGDEVICNVPLSRPFPNLKKLGIGFSIVPDIPEESRWNIFEVMLADLPQLEEIDMTGGIITESSLLGSSPAFSLMARFPNLNTLSFVACNLESITDRCFDCVFKNMRLRLFQIQPLGRTQVTFNGGISTLASGPFRETIESLHCFLPPDAEGNEIKIRHWIKENFPRLMSFSISKSPMEN